MIALIALLIFIMFTRANRELLGGGQGAAGSEDPWDLATPDLTPCDPTNSLVGESNAWEESGGDLKPKATPATDANWTVSGSDLIANAV